jgi:glycosyltransferase involved in cell wall biosynthesis
MLRRVRHAFVSNEGLKELLSKQLLPERISVVFDYVDLDVFAPDRIAADRVAELAARHKPRGTRILIYLGMFKDYQGVHYLIRAFAELADRHPDLRLMLIGDGPCRVQYEELVRQHALEQRVVMPGLVPHHDVVNWLALADVVVSPRV